MVEQALNAPGPSGQIITLNMSAVTFVDSTGLGLLVNLTKQARKNAKELCLSGVRPEIRTTLRLLKLDQFLLLEPALPATGAAPAVAQPMSFTWLGPAQAKVGGKFSVTLNTRTGDTVRNLPMMISYDPSLLKAVEAAEGTFMRQGGAGAHFTREIDQAGGQITVDAAAGEQGAKGGGTLTTITFEVVAAGTSEISVARVAPSGPTGDAVNFTPPAAHSVTLNP